MQVSLSLRIYLAVISGGAACVAFIVLVDSPGAAVIPGALFATGVLLPWLHSADAKTWRPVALVVISAVSFHAAVYTANHFDSPLFGPKLKQYIAASVVGAGIVLTLTPFVLRLRLSWRLAVVGALAALVAGALFEWVSDNLPYGMLLAFGLWHVALALSFAFAYAMPSSETLLAALAPKWRRALIVLVTLVVALPLTDDAVAFLLQSHYESKDGGIEIMEPVVAHGFLDRRREPYWSSKCEFRCLTPVVEGRFAFQEYRVDGRYEQFFVTSADDLNCKRSGEAWTTSFEPVFSSLRRPGEGHCLSYRRNDTPASRYALIENVDYISALLGLYSLRRTEIRLVRIRDEAVMTEKISYSVDTIVFNTDFGEDEDWATFFDAVLPKPETAWSPPETALGPTGPTQ